MQYMLCCEGLDVAGKTTILYKLKLGDIVITIPTIGESFHSTTDQHGLDLGTQPLFFIRSLCFARNVLNKSIYNL